jgi:DNA-binding transcriptional MerR regulator
MTWPPRMLLIGEFAQRCRLPVSTLRYYDRIGLLAPALVDPATGYRRYAVGQLAAAVLIARLRGIGTAPRDIAAIVAGGAQAAAVLAAERDRLAAQAGSIQRALAQIEDLLACYQDQPSGRVTLVDLAPERVATAGFAVPYNDLAPGVLRSIAGLRMALRRAGCQRTGPWGATFPLQITGHVRGFVFARTIGDAHPGLDTAWLPAGPAARGVHRGGPDTLAMSYHAALQTAQHRGRRAVGPVIEEYLALDRLPAGNPSIRLTVPLTSLSADHPGPAGRAGGMPRRCGPPA